MAINDSRVFVKRRHNCPLYAIFEVTFLWRAREKLPETKVFVLAGPFRFFCNRDFSMKEPVSCLVSMPNRTGVVWSPEESGLGFFIAQREVAANRF